MLAPTDRVQKRLLREMALSEVQALEMYSLAPLPSRRDMAMLGFLHRVALGHTSAQIRDLFPLAAPPLPGRIPTILSMRRHDRQFREPLYRTDVFKRSAFGLTAVYNLLPAHVVASESVKAFQSLLQKALRKAAHLGINNWQRLFAPDHRSLGVVAFQRLFDA